VEIRIHGRGGQGAVYASQMLASAFFLEGKYPQCFSSFGGERRGVAVVGFVRVDKSRIRRRCEITSPDHVICLDASLLSEAPVTQGLKDKGCLLINCEELPAGLEGADACRLYTVDATQIAHRYNLGGLVNTAILGAYARISQAVELDTIVRVIRESVPTNVEANEQAARAAYQEVNSLHGDN
jgi:2-oxoacid:acceptor oxidoreductase gamma subunit (pyruvate/2-ketoisovalerate family)